MPVVFVVVVPVTSPGPVALIGPDPTVGVPDSPAPRPVVVPVVRLVVLPMTVVPVVPAPRAVVLPVVRPVVPAVPVGNAPVPRGLSVARPVVLLPVARPVVPLLLTVVTVRTPIGRTNTTVPVTGRGVVPPGRIVLPLSEPVVGSVVPVDLPTPPPVAGLPVRPAVPVPPVLVNVDTLVVAAVAFCAGVIVGDAIPPR